MGGYSNGIQSVHVISGVDLDTATAAGNIVGPAGLTGRVVGMTARVTGDTATAVSTVTLRTKGGAGNSYASIAVPVAPGVDSVHSGFVVDDVSDTPTHVGRIPADEILEVISDGGSSGTTAAAEISVFIEWSYGR